MDSTSLFRELFPEEKIQDTRSGYLGYVHKKRNIVLGPYKLGIGLNPLEKCKVIIGEKHVLIDNRRVSMKSLEQFLCIIPFTLLIILFYFFFINRSIIFLSLCLFGSWPIPVMLFLYFLTSIRGGSTSYLLEKSWLDEIKKDENVTLKVTVPPGKPFYLGQYLATNNIEVPGLLSGRTAWFGSEIPWIFVDNKLHFRIYTSLKYIRLIKAIVFIFPLLSFWLAVHLLNIMINQFNSFT